MQIPGFIRKSNQYQNQCYDGTDIKKRYDGQKQARGRIPFRENTQGCKARSQKLFVRTAAVCMILTLSVSDAVCAAGTGKSLFTACARAAAKTGAAGTETEAAGANTGAAGAKTGAAGAKTGAAGAKTGAVGAKTGAAGADDAIPDFKEDAQIETAFIGTVEEFLEFAENCEYDSFGDGKRFVLTADLDFSGVEFSPVPIFGGTLDGDGHSLSNVSISGKGSGIGLIGRLKENGSVVNLTVTGSVKPTGSRENIGGIVGINGGRIENCRFQGELSGSEAAGGIAGLNEESGRIAGCTNEAVVTSEKRAGGIAGRNAGWIETSENLGQINVWEEKNVTEDIGGIAGFNEGIIKDCTNGGIVGYEHIGYNVGGIAGRHNGRIEGCENNASVSGRKDVGGIVGQFEPYLMLVYEEDSVQAMDKALSGLRGILSDLTGEATALIDSGTKNGKELNRQLGRLKDVSTDSLLTADHNGKDSWEQLDGALTVMNEEIDSFAGKCDAYRESTKNSVDAIQNAVKRIRTVTKKAIDTADLNLSKTLDDISADVTVINREIEELSYSVDGSSTAVHSSLSRIKKEAANMNDALESMKNTVKNSTDACLTSCSDALDIIRNEVDSLLAAGEKGGEESAKPELQEMSDYVSQASELLRQAQEEGGDLRNLSGELSDTLDELEKQSAVFPDYEGPDADQIRESLKVIGEQADVIRSSISEAFKSAGNALDTGLDSILSSLSVISDEAGRLTDEIDSAIGRITSGVRKINRNLSNINQTLDAFSDTVSADKERLEADLKSPFDTLSLELYNLADQTNEISKSLTAAVQTIHDQAAVIESTFDTSIRRLSDGFDTTVNEMSEILNEINGIIDQMADETGEANAGIKAQLKRLDRQLELIEAIAADAGEDIESLGESGLYTDISDTADGGKSGGSDTEETGTGETDTKETDARGEEAPSILRGEIAGCINRGEAEADVNAGGIAGIAALELSGDPEVDVSFTQMGKKSLKSFRYAKAVISSSVNQADVTVKNTYAGGIVGRADLGAVTECVNLGTVENQGGAFTGGIAGYCAGVVRNCHVLCDLKGGDDTGGIAGGADEIYGCTAIVAIDSEGERIGAVAGKIETLAADNYFLKEGLAGVDGVNYEGIAMPLAYEELEQIKSVPQEFFEIRIQFMADGQLIKTVPAGYGEEFPEDEIPEIPKKEGFYAKWESFDTAAVTRSRIVDAQYFKWLTTIASQEKEGERPILLAEGKFSDQAVLSVEATDDLSVRLPIGWEYRAAYRFAVEDPLQEEIALTRVRIYAPEETGGRVSVLISGRKTVLSETDCIRDGSYLVFDLNEPCEFIVVSREAGKSTAEYLLFGAAGAVVIGVIIVFAVKKSKKKKIGERLKKR